MSLSIFYSPTKCKREARWEVSTVGLLRRPQAVDTQYKAASQPTESQAVTCCRSQAKMKSVDVSLCSIEPVLGQRQFDSVRSTK